MADLSGWGRALTLGERDRLLPPGDPSPPEPGSPAASSSLEELVATWRRESALEDAARFRLRLEQQGLDEARFQDLLASPPPPPAAEDQPSWLGRLLAERSETPVAPRREDESGVEPDDAPRESLPDEVFLGLFQPLLGGARRQLAEALAAAELQLTLGGAADGSDSFDSGPVDSGSVDSGSEDEATARARFVEAWFDHLPRQLLEMSTRTLLLELYVQRLEGVLDGATPEARFQSFLRRVGPTTTAALALFDTYPVLGRAIAVRLEQWVEVGFELASRLGADLGALGETFGPDRAGRIALAGLAPGLGDRHDGGRTVVRLDFEGGWSVVYKPRSLALDVRFQELLEWLGTEGVEPPLRTLAVLDRGAYGYVERVEGAPCRSLDEVRRFYQRQGVYLALLYALEATDFHHENVIASGEHPMLIDLESLFQPVVADPAKHREDLNPVLTTVLRSGLLPRRSWSEGGPDGMDLSGLGAARGQRVASRILQRSGTDEMHYADGESEMVAGRHLPLLQPTDSSPEEVVPVWAMSGPILRAFRRTYSRLLELREAFVEPGGWLDRFTGLETRAILRPTGLYVRLLHAAYHPDYLQDALRREQLFDKLWLDAVKQTHVAALVPSERQALWQGDVPRFGSRTDTRDAQAPDGSILVDCLADEGLSMARRRFAELSKDDLARQLELVRLALVAARPSDALEGPDLDLAHAPAAAPLRPAPPRAGKGPGGALADGALAAARRIAVRLDTLAFREEGWLSWFSIHPGGGRFQRLEPVGYDLYAGLAGIALFWAHLGALTGEARWRQRATAALATARDRFQRQDADAPGSFGVGGYSGLGGWMYSLVVLSDLDPAAAEDLLDEAAAIRDRIPAALASDEGLDQIAGAAGCIGALLALAKRRPSARTLAVATACGERLLARSTPQSVGAAWCLPKVADRPLTGYAHGAAGFASALGSLAAATGDARFSAAARAALDYERSLFDPALGTWPDLRVDRRADGAGGTFYAWCHGAPGIGLGRLELLAVDADPANRLAVDDPWDRELLRTEVAAAVAATRRHGLLQPDASHCLCHGELGNLELLSDAARQLGDEALNAEAGEIARQILDDLETRGPRSGISSPVDLPGLLTGLAGIGYGLLRIADPDRVPSVLRLNLRQDLRQNRSS